MMTESYNTGKYSKYILETVGSLEYPDSLLLTQENDVHRDINHLNSFLSRFSYISRCLSLLFTLSIYSSIFLILFSPSISLLHLSPMSFPFPISVFHFNSTSFLPFFHLLFLYHLLSIFLPTTHPYESKKGNSKINNRSNIPIQQRRLIFRMLWIWKSNLILEQMNLFIWKVKNSNWL